MFLKGEWKRTQMALVVVKVDVCEGPGMCGQGGWFLPGGRWGTIVVFEQA